MVRVSGRKRGLLLLLLGAGCVRESGGMTAGSLGLVDRRGPTGTQARAKGKGREEEQHWRIGVVWSFFWIEKTLETVAEARTDLRSSWLTSAMHSLCNSSRTYY